MDLNRYKPSFGVLRSFFAVAVMSYRTSDACIRAMVSPSQRVDVVVRKVKGVRVMRSSLPKECLHTLVHLETLLLTLYPHTHHQCPQLSWVI
jgi:hypothetical protein